VLWITHVSFLILPHHQLQTRLKLVAGSAHAPYGPHLPCTRGNATFEKQHRTIEDASVYFEDAIGVLGGFVWCLSFFSWRDDRSDCTTVTQEIDTKQNKSLTHHLECAQLVRAWHTTPKILEVVSSPSHIATSVSHDAAFPLCRFRSRGSSIACEVRPQACIGRSQLRRRR
jgi:hypothetical protein